MAPPAVLGVREVRPALLVNVPGTHTREDQTGGRAGVVRLSMAPFELEDDLDDDLDEDDDEDGDLDDEDEDEEEDEEEIETWQVSRTWDHR